MTPQGLSKSRAPYTQAAAPARRIFFDPWNSSGSGHQRAENRLSGSTSWRASRNLKLGRQYRGEPSGGSTAFGDDVHKENGGLQAGAAGLIIDRQKSLTEAWGASKPGNKAYMGKELRADGPQPNTVSNLDADDRESQRGQHAQPPSPAKSSEKQIFAGLCFYINGSTAPLVSDHKLKQFLALHGAKHSIALGRRTVTHVILSTTSAHGGTGGGLAATKIQKEIARSGGKAVKFITAEWVLESIKAGRRLPESRFSPLKLASKTQNSVFGMLQIKQEQG